MRREEEWSSLKEINSDMAIARCGCHYFTGQGGKEEGEERRERKQRGRRNGEVAMTNQDDVCCRLSLQVPTRRNAASSGLHINLLTHVNRNLSLLRHNERLMYVTQ
jgi:hypothetical protein